MDLRQNLALVAVLAAGMLAATASAFEPVNAPITLKATPATAIVKARVTLSGTSLVLGKNNQVAINVTGTGPPQELKATIDASGAYKLDFTPAAEGKYTVVATAPDGKGKAQALITVASPAGAAALSSVAPAALVKTAQKAQDIGDAQVANLPPSPAKDEFQKKSAELKKHLDKLPQAQKEYEKAYAKFYELGAKYPDTLPALKPLFDDIERANEDIKRQNEELEKRLAGAAKKNATCDSLEAASEAFSAISTAMNLIGKPWKILAAFTIDKGPGKVVETVSSNAATPEAKFAIAETFKVSASILVGGAAAGPIAIGTAAVGVASDCAQFFTQQKFAKYCEKFEGPVYAQFRQELREKGKPYYTYKLDIRGKIQLRYAKGAAVQAGQPIPLTGQIEGMVEAFDMAEDAILIAPQLRSRVLVRKIIPPIGSRYSEDIGAIARMGLPHSFYIPVKGELKDNKITLKLEPATKDFSDLIRAEIFYVFIEPSLPIPSVQSIRTDIQKAFFIFDRGMRANPQLDVKTDSTKSIAEKVFKREVEEKGADYKVEWKIDVKACNPGCLPQLYFSKAN